MKRKKNLFYEEVQQKVESCTVINCNEREYEDKVMKTRHFFKWRKKIVIVLIGEAADDDSPLQVNQR